MAPSTSTRARDPALSIRQVATEADIAAIRDCFAAYMAWLDEDVSFQDYSAELRDLPGKYAPPTGALLLAVDSQTGSVLGCLAMRPLNISPEYLTGGRRPEDRYCELKRLFVHPEARGRGVSRALVREILARAEGQGYQEAFLDTLGKMQSAVGLYESEGFRRTAAYCFNPLQDAMYFSKRLGDTGMRPAE